MLTEKHPYKYEIEAWLRTLDYLQQENIHMKTRIAELIERDHITSGILEQFEFYQNALLNKDTVIGFFRKDIRDLETEIYARQEIRHRLSVLRSDMNKMENEFVNLKADFNEYIAGLDLINKVS